MLIRKIETVEGGVLGIWKIEESAKQLISLFPKQTRAEAERGVETLRSEKRALEWLASRLMLMELLGIDKIARNRKDGRPYVEDINQQISISHTRGYVAVLLHKSARVGVDIEIISHRIERIANKFISNSEYIDPQQRIQHLLLHWSAKESLFKLIDEGGIDFKKQLHIEPFNPTQTGIIRAFETKTCNSRSYRLCYEVQKEYVLTWVIDS